MAAFLEAEGLTCRAGGRGPARLALVGYSLGARLALVLAARHGALFDSVRLRGTRYTYYALLGMRWRCWWRRAAACCLTQAHGRGVWGA